MRERGTGGIQAVQAYEAHYGVLVEKPIDNWDFPHTDITEAEFERIWTDSRRLLESTP